ncbi:MAG: DUF2232 domain-containing protein [Clostridia bacterium]|nr:DUF2232 domain-containing protein [Clostridia bacterium]
MKNKFNVKAIIMFAAAVALAFAGVYSPILLYLCPVFLAATFAYSGIVFFVLAIGMLFSGVIYLTDITSALYIMLTVLPSAIALSCLFKGRCSYRTAVIACVVAIAISLYVTTFVPYLLEGKTAVYAIDDKVTGIVEAFRSSLSLYETMPEYEALAASADEMSKMIFSMSEELVFATITIQALCYGFLQVIAGYLMLGKSLALKKMAHFKDWQIPKSYLWGSLMILGASIILSETGVSYAGAFSVVAGLIIVAPFALVGVATMEFFVQITPEGKGFRRVLTYGMALLCFPFSIFMLAIEGIADRLFSLRKRIIVIKKP